MEWVLVGLGIGVGAGLVLLTGRRWLRGVGRTTVLRFRTRIDRYKLVDRRVVRDVLLLDPEVGAAIARHAEDRGITPAAARARARHYVDEIVPSFNILSYYKVAYTLARVLTRLFYRTSVPRLAHSRPGAKRDTVVYVMNHRSNMDPVALTYLLAGVVSVSYAVGEWARTWPLEPIFKSFGSYFVRRRYPEHLYHTVLARYVQLVTKNGVTQALFPEGGLTRDGSLRPPKLGLLDNIVGTLRDPTFAGEIWVVPTAINYDRVLEDRALTRELVADTQPASRWSQAVGVLTFLASNVLGIVGGQRRRLGQVAVRFGTPIGLRAWVRRSEQAALDADRGERRASIERLAGEIMTDIGRLVPATPASVGAVALLSFQASVVARAALLDRLAELRGHLDENLDPPEIDVGELWARAWQSFRSRRWVVAEGDHVVIMPRARPLLEYYANAIRHLLPTSVQWALSPATDHDPSLPSLRPR